MNYLLNAVAERRRHNQEFMKLEAKITARKSIPDRKPNRHLGPNQRETIVEEGILRADSTDIEAYDYEMTGGEEVVSDQVEVANELFIAVLEAVNAFDDSLHDKVEADKITVMIEEGTRGELKRNVEEEQDCIRDIIRANDKAEKDSLDPDLTMRSIRLELHRIGAVLQQLFEQSKH